MTIIVGAKIRGEVWLAADTREVDETGFISPSPVSKLRRTGPWLVGLSGPARFAEFFEYDKSYPTIVKMRDGFLKFVKELGCEPLSDKEEAGGPPVFDFDLLVAGHGELWQICCDGGLAAISREFAAIGSGCSFAYGAAHALLSLGCGGKELAHKAAQAAIALCAHCSGDIDIECA